jgi:hypothetical protein
MEVDMVTLLTLDGVEDVDYTPSDAEIRASLDDSGLYGMVLGGVTWMRLSSGAGWWTVICNRRVTATLAAVGWCWVADGCGARGYWSPALACVPADVRSMCGGCTDDEDEEGGDGDG